MTDNPLLQLTSLPDFNAIRAEHVVPTIRQLLEQTAAEQQQLEADLEPTWAGLMQPLERLENRLSLAWGAVGHLMGVKNSEALRQAHQEVQGEVVQFWMQLGQSQAIYQGLKSLKASEAWTQLETAQQRIVDLSIKDAELAGVGLEGEPRARFNAIQQELAELSTTFSNHLLDATKAFHLDLHQPEEIEGCRRVCCRCRLKQPVRPVTTRPRPSADRGALLEIFRVLARFWSTATGGICASRCTGRSSPGPVRASWTTRHSSAGSFNCGVNRRRFWAMQTMRS